MLQFSYLQKEDSNVGRGTLIYKRDHGFGAGTGLQSSKSVSSLITPLWKDLCELHENLYK